jgi:hypothetical protein
VPWVPEAVGWFNYEGGGIYCFRDNLIDVPSIDIAFYMGHSISGHFGHFIGDCLSRMHAWRTARDFFGNIPIVLEHSEEDTGFREKLLLAAGAREQDIIFIQGPVHCPHAVARISGAWRRALRVAGFSGALAIDR